MLNWLKKVTKEKEKKSDMFDYGGGVAWQNNRAPAEKKDPVLKVVMLGDSMIGKSAPMYYRGAHAVVLGFDVCRPETLAEAKRWFAETQAQLQGVAEIILVGMKSDLPESQWVNSIDEAEDWAASQGLEFALCSAKTGENVEKIMHRLVANALARQNLVVESAPLRGAHSKAKAAARSSDYADVNIFTVQMNRLADPAEMATGEPVLCRGCGLCLNVRSRLGLTGKSLQKGTYGPQLVPDFGEFGRDKAQKGDQAWVCEFCEELNYVDVAREQVPTSSMVDYMVSTLPGAASTVPSVVFCLDISGSMCVTAEVEGRHLFKGGSKNLPQLIGGDASAAAQYLPHERRNVTHASRLQCLQAAVENQLEALRRDSPRTKVGLVCFADDVQIYGDCMQAPQTVAGDALSSLDELGRIGAHYQLDRSIEDAFPALQRTLWELEEGGQTALGPALLLSVLLAARPGSQVVICTDGLANKGIGGGDEKSSARAVFVELAEQAKLLGVSVSIISIMGTDCDLDNLSIVSRETGGTVERVLQTDLGSKLNTVWNKKAVAHVVMSMTLLPKVLEFKGEMDDTDRRWLLHDLGTVTNESRVSIGFTFAPNAPKLNEVPFQVQIRFTRLDGTKCLRVATTYLKTTNDRAAAEAQSNHAAARAARLAKDGRYDEAQAELRSAQEFLERNAVVLNDDVGQHVRQFDRLLAQAERNDDVLAEAIEKTAALTFF